MAKRGLGWRDGEKAVEQLKMSPMEREEMGEEDAKKIGVN